MNSPLEELNFLREANQALRMSLDQWHSLQGLSSQISVAHDEDSLYEAIASILPGILPTNGFEASFQATARAEKFVRKRTFPAGNPLPSLPESAREWLMGRPSVSAYPLGEGRGVLFCPLFFQNARLGHLAIHVEDDLTCFTESTQAAISLVAGQVATALHSLRATARLVQQAEHHHSTQLLLDGVLSSVDQGVFALDFEQCVSFANPAGLALLGKPAFLVSGSHFTTAFPSPVSLWISERLPALLQGVRIPPSPVEFPRMDGSSQAAELRATPLKTGDGRGGLVLVMRSLDESRELARLHEIDRMKDEIISVISHEMRTPLASVQAYADALVQGIFDEGSERDDALKTIQSEALRLTALVNDFLDLAKIRAGKMEFQFALQDAADLVRESLNSIRSLALEKGILLESDIPSEFITYFGDNRRIQQVLINLLSNAIKFSPPQSTIHIRVERGESQVVFSVRDEGSGIDPTSLPHIFDPFYQAESGRRLQKGTGLGLSICTEILARHGSAMQVQSRLGEGSRFYFHLSASAPH